MKGTITTSDNIYTLKVTSNKRNVIYDTNGVFNRTEPFHYDELHYIKTQFDKNKKVVS
jgi:hypothetical protein